LLVRVNLSSTVCILSSSATLELLSNTSAGSIGSAGHSSDVQVARAMQCDDVKLKEMLTPNAQLCPR
jgi:hypothetical protein